MKTFIKKHIVALCGVISIIAALLPFVSLDLLYETTTATIFGIFSGYGNFSALVIIIIPIIIIAIDFILKDKAKKIACIVLSAVNLIAVAVSFLMVKSSFEAMYIIASPAIGLYLVAICDIALIVLSVMFAGNNFEELSDTGKKAKEVSKKAAEKVASAGSEAVSFTKEQAELASLKSEVNVIDKEIEASYLMTGKKYVDYVLENNEMPGIDVSDILKLMDPKMERRNELEEKMIKLEKRILDEKVIREKQAAEKEFEEEKEKLDKALKMDIIDQADYDSRMSVLKKKLDNFEIIRKLNKQVELGLITEEEKNSKLFDIMN